MLRPYLRYHRDLLKDLCRIAHECLRDVMRTSLDQPEGMPGIVMVIHTFGEYLDFHPHLHLLMADGLFLRDERFLVLPENGMNAVEELFRARLITFLTGKGLLPPERAQMLKSWKHSGFNVHRSRRIMPDEREDLERVARNTRLAPTHWAGIGSTNRVSTTHSPITIPNPFFSTQTLEQLRGECFVSIHARKA